MRRLVSTKEIDRFQWLLVRKQGLGGSDAAAVCGLSPFKSTISVYQDKTTDVVEEYDNEAMRQGRDLEEYVARRFCEATGKKVRRANFLYYDEKNPFMLADFDRLVVGENAGLECKTSSLFMQEHWADGKIPIYYQLQCYHYMAISGSDSWYLAVLFLGGQFKYFKLERDEEIIRNLVQIERDFWNNHVLARKLPSPDGSKCADSVIAENFKAVPEKKIMLDGFDEKLRRRQELSEIMERMEKEKKTIEQELKIYMGEAEMALSDSFRVSWKEVSAKRLDEKKLKEEQPEIYDQYVKNTVSRRLLIKAA